MPRSSSALSTPMCAKPFIPPPPNTRAIFRPSLALSWLGDVMGPPSTERQRRPLRGRRTSQMPCRVRWVIRSSDAGRSPAVTPRLLRVLIQTVKQRDGASDHENRPDVVADERAQDDRRASYDHERHRLSLTLPALHRHYIRLRRRCLTQRGCGGLESRPGRRSRARLTCLLCMTQGRDDCGGENENDEPCGCDHVFSWSGSLAARMVARFGRPV